MHNLKIDTTTFGSYHEMPLRIFSFYSLNDFKEKKEKKILFFGKVNYL